MNCLDCKAKFKVKEIKSTARHCPSCGHEIVAMPKEDGISDGKIAKLMRRLAGEERLPVYPEHLAYALMASKSKPTRTSGCVVVTLTLLIAFALAQFWLIPLILVISWFIWKRNSRREGRYDKAIELARRFGKVNHAFPEDAEAPLATALDETLGATCKQVLVVSNTRFARFLHEAQFPLKEACPVLGPELEGLTIYPGLEARLSSDDTLKIVVLTDYTPAGANFAKSLPGPLATRDNVHHIGMDYQFVSAREAAMRPMTEFRGANTLVARHMQKNGAELFVFGPVSMLPALGVALTTMMLLPPEGQASEAGFELDSE